jgi:hypothetical protein
MSIDAAQQGGQPDAFGAGHLYVSVKIYIEKECDYDLA